MANNQKIGSGNRNQAPKLAFQGEKFNGDKEQAYIIPQELADIIFNDKEFSRSPAPIKLMLTLIGTKVNFGVSEAWVLQRTGMDGSTYNTVRKKLVAKGWLKHENGYITVDYDSIYGRNCPSESHPQNFEVVSNSIKKTDSNFDTVSDKGKVLTSSVTTPKSSDFDTVTQQVKINEQVLIPREQEILRLLEKQDDDVLIPQENAFCPSESLPITYNKQINITNNIEQINNIQENLGSMEDSGLVYWIPEIEFGELSEWRECGGYTLKYAIDNLNCQIVAEDDLWYYVITGNNSKVKFDKKSNKQYMDYSNMF